MRKKLSMYFSRTIWDVTFIQWKCKVYLHIWVSTQVVEEDTNQMLHSMLWSIMHGCIVVVMVPITAIGRQTSAQFRRVLKDLHCGVFVSMLEIFLEFGRCTAHGLLFILLILLHCYLFWLWPFTNVWARKQGRQYYFFYHGCRVVNPCSLREIREERHTYNSLVLQHHKIHFYPKFRRLNFALSQFE